jgi:hypothetical protein
MSKPAWTMLVVSILLAAGAVSAQELPPLSNQYAPGVPVGAYGGGMPVSGFPVVTGRPFRANVNSRSIQPFPGGTLKTYEYHGVMARDSQGRIMRESPEAPFDSATIPTGGFAYSPHGVSVTDPIAKVSIQWQDMSKMVMKMNLLPNQMRAQTLNICEAAAGAARGGRVNPNRRVEDLGEKRIQGLAAVGCRITTIVPASREDPNQEAITVTEESWSSTELGVMLIHIHHDTRGSDLLDRLDDIVREEPDPAIFQPPANYTTHDLEAEREKEEREAVPIAPESPTPAMLAGPWEADDPIAGKGTQFGIFLDISATRNVQRVRGGFVADGSGRFRSLEINVYQRTLGKESGGWFSFGQSGDSTTTKWDGQRLQINFNGDPRTSFKGAMALDLTFSQTQQVWTGTYTRDGATNQVRLQRPGAGQNAKPHPLVGIWTLPGHQMGQSTESGGCIQVTRSADGTFAAWYRRGGLPMFNVRANQGTLEDNAGQRWGVIINGDSITLDEGRYMYTVSGTGPIKFVGKLSDDGSQLIGRILSELEDKPSQHELDAPPSILARTNGESCSSAFPAPSQNFE